MGSSIRYTSTILKNKNKKGIIKPDSNGYYPMAFGALGVNNEQGDYYTLEGAKKLLDSCTTMRKALAMGQLGSENGHPVKLPGQSNEDFAVRWGYVLEKRVCGEIREVELTKENNMIHITGHIKPSGELGHVLSESIKDPNSNTAFSFRGWTLDTYVTERSAWNKLIDLPVTFDKVTMPGIPDATKYNSMACENSQPIRLVDEPVLPETIELMKSVPKIKGMTCESKEVVEELIAILDVQPAPKKIYSAWR